MEKDKDFLERIANADETAFKYFFDKYVNKVYQFIYNFVKDKAEAEDITQIVFIKIWTKKSTITKISSLDGYVFTVAYRLVIDHYRSSETKFKKHVSNDYNTEILLSSNSAEDAVNKHQLESIYEKALNVLPPKRREIFVLSRHDGLTNKQIAVKLNISIKTVESHMTASLSALKGFLSMSDLSIVIVFGLFIFP